MKTVITAHDLAFKFFPETFPRKDLQKLNLLADYSFPRADKIIAISESTKNDLLKCYPKIQEENIEIVYHGFESNFWQQKNNLSPAIMKSGRKERRNNLNQSLKRYNLKSKQYLIYVGAIQPRKNLNLLIDAFGKVKKNYPELKLVLAGGDAWLNKKIHQCAQKSKFAEDIIFTGGISFETMRELVHNAKLFTYPPLYEGFGIPILEAMASGIPVVCANNSSLPEAGGEAVEYFQSDSVDDCQFKIEKVLDNPKLQNEMIKKGFEQIKKFSWKKCARETLEILRG